MILPYNILRLIAFCPFHVLSVIVLSTECKKLYIIESLHRPWSCPQHFPEATSQSETYKRFKVCYA